MRLLPRHELNSTIFLQARNRTKSFASRDLQCIAKFELSVEWSGDFDGILLAAASANFAAVR